MNASLAASQSICVIYISANIRRRGVTPEASDPSAHRQWLNSQFNTVDRFLLRSTFWVRSSRRSVVRTGSRSSREYWPAIKCICSYQSPPSLAVSDLMRKMKGRSSHKVQREFPQLKKRYWGRHFWGRGYFSTTNGAITEDIVLQYLETHSDKSTDASRYWFKHF